jgi:hypothetical protein
VRSRNLAFIAAVLFAQVSLAAQGAQASTILKLSLGGDAGADIEFDGTTLSTADDGDAATTGDQNTDAEFLTFLDGVAADILDVASFTLDGLTADGAPVIINGVVVGQGFNDGALSLYDAANSLLLSATLEGSVLTAMIGGTATGSLFTASFATVTGGSLAPLIDPGTLTLSISMVDINGGAGVGVAGIGAVPVLEPFSADATLLIDAEEQEVTEPASALLLLGAALASVAARRRR